MHCASDTDLTEAYNAGKMALQYASQGESGKMVSINRLSNEPYEVNYPLVNAEDVANNVKYFPIEWINKEGNFCNT